MSSAIRFIGWCGRHYGTSRSRYSMICSLKDVSFHVVLRGQVSLWQVCPEYSSGDNMFEFWFREFTGVCNVTGG